MGHDRGTVRRSGATHSDGSSERDGQKKKSSGPKLLKNHWAGFDLVQGLVCYLLVLSIYSASEISLLFHFQLIHQKILHENPVFWGVKLALEDWVSFADSVLGIVWAWNFAGLLGEELLNAAREVLQRGARALDETRGTRQETCCWKRVENPVCFWLLCGMLMYVRYTFSVP